jgi:hypothetical protein
VALFNKIETRESNNGIAKEKPMQFLGARFTETKIKLMNDEYFIIDHTGPFTTRAPKKFECVILKKKNLA